MIDVNKITSTLAKLPDQQLQQYAQMHKNDPYIMALAMSESNRRKELRAASQESMQEQPKVVDQMVAEMAPQQMPEDQGIGQLPAGDMNFAGGGIIAFADGGDVERYQSQGLVRLPNEDFAAYRRRIFDAEMQAQQDRNIAEAQAREAERQRILGARGENNMVPPSPFFERAPMAFNPAQTADTQPATKPAAPVASPTDPNFRRQTDPRLLGIAATAPSVPPITSGPGPTANNKPAAPSAPSAPSAPVEDKGTSGLDALINKFTRETDLAQGALKNQRVGIASQLEQSAREEKEEGEKRRTARGDVFAKKEGRLAEREKDIAGLNDKYMGLALLQAGAAMMSTPGNLGSVIGKGVQVGSERYIAGIDKINAAKDKFAEARDRLDDLRLNRDDMNEKEIRDENRAIRNARLQGQQLYLDGATNDLKISTDNQRAIFTTAADAIQTNKKLASAESIAATGERGANARSAAQVAATLNTPDRILFDQLLTKNNNDAVKALEAFKQAKGDKFDVRTSYADYLKAFAGKEGLTPPMTMGAYAGQFGATLPR
jgi:hypothetical protein